MADQPNILWICTDQQRWDTIGAWGNDAIRTPNLDRLCREGVSFTRTYCQSPICTPSRTSFLTGLYASSVHGNINGNRRFNVPENARLVTARLRDAGYDCGLSGKLHIASAWNGEEPRVDDGYRRFWYSHSATQGHNQGNQYCEWLEEIGRFDEVLDISGYQPDVKRGVKLKPDFDSKLHQTAWCCDRAIDFMEEERTGPWLMSVNIFDPHPPYDVPACVADRVEADKMPIPPFRERDIENQNRLSTHVFQGKPKRPDDAQQRRAANYYAMIELIDANVGRLLDALDRTGQRENTVVIFMSDHGQLLGDHGLENKGCRFYEGLVRVPLIICWPGRFAADHTVSGLVELTDLAPTLCELADVDPGWTQGKSLVPHLEAEGDSTRHRDYVRCEFYDVLDMSWNTGNAPPPPSYATMHRTDRYKLSAYHGSDYGELYDLEADPDEFENLWEASAAQKLKADLIKQSYDASTVIHDPGSVRIGRF